MAGTVACVWLVTLKDGRSAWICVTHDIRWTGGARHSGPKVDSEMNDIQLFSIFNKYSNKHDTENEWNTLREKIISGELGEPTEGKIPNWLKILRQTGTEPSVPLAQSASERVGRFERLDTDD
jgi:hypothetical protein